MVEAKHLSMAELEAGMDTILGTPKDDGRLVLIVSRPQVDQRAVLEEAQLDTREGLVGDTWSVRGSSRTADGSSNLEAQITLMNARVIALLAQDKARWSLAGDQLYVDLDLSAENLPAGTRLELGTAILEVTAEPHTGCSKFAARFGVDALKFVNGAPRKHLHLRGVNARVVRPGTIRLGDAARKLPR
jgi:hypothetical protein